MKFRVGPWWYKVRIAKNKGEGAPGEFEWKWDKGQNGWVHWAEAKILIRDGLGPQERLATLLHELRHVWDRHLGSPTDEEGRCENAASFTMDAMKQLERQGGIEALACLGADGIIHRGQLEEFPSPIDRAQCAQCQGLFSAGDIHQEPPRFDAQLKRLVVWRWVECDFCQKIQRWAEAATIGGTPTGRIVAGPIISSPPAAADRSAPPPCPDSGWQSAVAR